MKDVAGSGKIPYGPVCGDLAERPSKMFNVILVLTLIALVAFAAFLISDILSFKSNASYEESFSVFSFLNSKESETAMMDRQEDAIKLADPGRGREPAIVLENAAASNSSREDIGTPLSSLNGSEAAKGSLAGDDNTGNTGKRLDPTARANSSQNNASTLTSQTAGRAVAIINPSDSNSHKSDKKKKHSSSKNNIQANRDDASPSSTAVENLSQLNQSQLNQSQNHVNLSINMSLTQPESHMDLSSQSQSRINLSSNLSMNLSASAPKINATEIPSYLSRSKDTNISSISSGNNSTAISTSSALDADLTPVADFSAESNVGELSPEDNGTSNLDAGATIGPKDEVQIEPLPELSQASSAARDGEGIGNDNLDDEISDKLVDFNSGMDTKGNESFADPDGMDDGILLPGDVSSEPQYPEHSMTTDGEWPVDSPEEPTQFASPQADGFVNSDLDFAEPTGKVVPADKSSYEWQDAENKRISNRDKRDKPVKSPKRPTPPAKPARTRPVKPARDNSRD